MSKSAADDEKPPAATRRACLATTFDRAALLGPEALLEKALSLFASAGISDDSGLVLDAHLVGERLDGVIELCGKRRDLAVVALEAQSGLYAHPALASLDREESRAAVAATEATVRRAAAVGATFVVVRLGWVQGARRDWTFARDEFVRGGLKASLCEGLRGARDRAASVHVDRSRAALDRVCRVADGAGVTLLLKNGQRYVELPSPREVDLLRSDLAGAPLAPLYDRPAAHLTASMGIYPTVLSAAAFAGPIAYVGDACGALAALPPGTGDLGASSLDVTSAIRVFRPWPQLEDRELVAALRSLA